MYDFKKINMLKIIIIQIVQCKLPEYDDPYSCNIQHITIQFFKIEDFFSDL